MARSMGAFQTIATDFGFHRKPFSNTDADFFFTNTGYLDAYLRLLDGVRQRCGLLILAGEAGTGKTLLLRKLAQETPAQIKFVCCYSTNLDFDDLLVVICDQLGIIGHGRERMHKLKALKDYLHTYSEQGVEVALLIDEAHLLRGDTLSRLLTLARLRVKEQSMLQVVLSGTPVLEEMLAQHRALHALLASAVHVRLDSLSTSDVTGFIYQQLQSAGGPPPETLFPAAVTERIAGYTKGIPRLINMLCERALLLAQLNDQTTLSMALIDEAAEGLMLLRPEPIEPQIKISPIETARPANNDPVLKSLEQAPVHIDKLSLDRVGPSLSRIAPVPGTDETPAISVPPDTSRESERHGLFGARLLVILLAFLAGLLGGGRGLIYFSCNSQQLKHNLSLGAGTANPETAQAQAAAPPALIGVEPTPVPVPAADPKAVPATIP